jgi:hypothetical protein
VVLSSLLLLLLQLLLLQLCALLVLARAVGAAWAWAWVRDLVCMSPPGHLSTDELHCCSLHVQPQQLAHPKLPHTNPNLNLHTQPKPQSSINGSIGFRCRFEAACFPQSSINGLVGFRCQIKAAACFPLVHPLGCNRCC